jgi:hypothetical protein
MRVVGRGIMSGISPEPSEPQSAQSATANSISSSDPVSKSKFSNCKCKFVVSSMKSFVDIFCC